MNLLYGVIISSIVGSVIFLVLLLLRPITGKIFSKTWHYYCLLVPLVFLLGGVFIAISLTGLVSEQMIIDVPPIPAPQEIQGIQEIQGFQEMQMNVSLLPSPSPFPSYSFSFDMINHDVINSDVVHLLPVYISETNVNSTVIPVQSTSQLIQVEELMPYVERFAPFLLVLWVLGAIIFMSVNIRGYRKYRHIILNESLPFFTEWGSESGSDYKIQIIVSTTAHTPMLLGIIKPIIILPHMHFTEDELNMVLAHEMVHYRRKDLIVKLIMLVANAVHWFNPVVYALNRQLNTMCELSCDEKVVYEMDTQNRSFYGKTILQVLKHSIQQKNLVGNIAFATNLCNSKKNFKRRLTNLMNAKKSKKSITILAVVIGLIVVGGGFVISNMFGSLMPVYAGEAYFYESQETSFLQNETYVGTQMEIETEMITETEETSPFQNSFLWPLQEHTRVSSGFGTRINPITRREEFHTGLDIPAPTGTPIFAAYDGYVVTSDFIREFGHMIVLDHGNGYSTMYGQTSRRLVHEGNFVYQGEIIALVGSTGMSSGPHLHFEIRVNNQHIDPLNYDFIKIEQQVTLTDELAERIANSLATALPAPIPTLPPSAPAPPPESTFRIPEPTLPPSIPPPPATFPPLATPSPSATPIPSHLTPLPPIEITMPAFPESHLPPMLPTPAPTHLFDETIELRQQLLSDDITIVFASENGEPLDSIIHVGEIALEEGYYFHATVTANRLGLFVGATTPLYNGQPNFGHFRMWRPLTNNPLSSSVSTNIPYDIANGLHLYVGCSSNFSSVRVGVGDTHLPLTEITVTLERRPITPSPTSSPLPESIPSPTPRPTFDTHLFDETVELSGRELSDNITLVFVAENSSPLDSIIHVGQIALEEGYYFHVTVTGNRRGLFLGATPPPFVDGQPNTDHWRWWRPMSTNPSSYSLSMNIYHDVANGYYFYVGCSSNLSYGGGGDTDTPLTEITVTLERRPITA